MFSAVSRMRAALLLALLASPAILPVSAPVSAAAKMAAVSLNDEQVASIRRINNFINSYQSLQGDFVQISPRGTSTRGIMQISKPGKLRFEYEAPNPLLIVSDGKWLTITNKKKDRGDQVPLSSTPLRFIVSSQVDLLKETKVVGFEQANGFTTVALAERSGGLGGYIVLVFDENREELQQWVIVDGKGQRTTVQLGSLERDVAIDPKLFAVTITRKQNNKD